MRILLIKHVKRVERFYHIDGQGHFKIDIISPRYCVSSIEQKTPSDIFWLLAMINISARSDIDINRCRTLDIMPILQICTGQ